MESAADAGYAVTHPITTANNAYDSAAYLYNDFPDAYQQALNGVNDRYNFHEGTPFERGFKFGTGCADILKTIIGVKLAQAVCKTFCGQGLSSLYPDRGLNVNPFKGKTPAQIDAMLKKAGFTIKGKDPINGKGSYFHPESGRKYYLDPGNTYASGTEYPHVDIHYFDENGNVIPKDPKKKLPLGDKLNDN